MSEALIDQAAKEVARLRWEDCCKVEEESHDNQKKMEEAVKGEESPPGVIPYDIFRQMVDELLRL